MSEPDAVFHPPGPTRDRLGLFGFLALSLFVAAIGGWVTAGSVNGWYAGLAKPPFNPPNWLFGPAWTTLYILIAVAGWRVWRKSGFTRDPPAAVAFAAQTALNFAWSPLFFGLHRPDIALGCIALLLVAIAATILRFLRLDRTAAWMLVPYLGWVGFATMLNLAIWRLN